MGKAIVEAIGLAKDFKRKAAKKYHLKRVILFGSQARGRLREGSDIDLLIVSDRMSKRSEFMSELLLEWHFTQKKNYPVDFLPFTEKEFEEASNKITIVKQALEEGIEI